MSLISKIKSAAGGANIYLADIKADYKFRLYDITTQESETSTYIRSGEVDRITDISKHIIVIFDSYDAYESNDNIYYQFNYMLSSIIYDVKILNGGILTKINLIGHSRGGLTNLQYALDHPDLVDSLISIDTPYFFFHDGKFVR